MEGHKQQKRPISQLIKRLPFISDFKTDTLRRRERRSTDVSQMERAERGNQEYNLHLSGVRPAREIQRRSIERSRFIRSCDQSRC